MSKNSEEKIIVKDSQKTALFNFMTKDA